MVRALFLMLVFFSISISAQTPEKPKTYKFGEICKDNEKNWRSKFDQLLTKQSGKCDELIYLIVRARNKKENKSRKYLDYVAHSRSCDLEGRRIVITPGKFSGTEKMEIWIVPVGAEPPLVD